MSLLQVCKFVTTITLRQNIVNLHWRYCVFFANFSDQNPVGPLFFTFCDYDPRYHEDFEGAIISEKPFDILLEGRGRPREIPRGQVVW